MIELRNITYHVKDEAGEKDVLDNVSLTLDGHFVALTGPNGGGKSTLAKVIAGIIRPTAGKVLWNGEDITDLSVTERARKGISYAFQQPVRFKGLTVKDLLSIAAGKNATLATACEYLSEVGLCARDYLDREVNASLSGGELKRIEIATILARGTKLSLFDEPEAGIDLWSFSSLINVFEKMREKTQGDIIIISHQERILSVADHIVVLANGKVQKSGTREEVLPSILGANAACKTLTEKLPEEKTQAVREEEKA
ncbi:MAG TPA: ABC transporter ATP-binding protein [Clostridiales bacterium]|nr:ABC transporter ATP-binding protein [Clostridiales bacterium]